MNASLRHFLTSVVLVAAACGTVAAMLFARASMTLSHDDTRGPLVVAGVALSIASFAMAAGSAAWIVSRVSDSLWPAAAAAFVLIINPNLLYLQSTPRTEPLLLGTTLLAVALLVEWCARPDMADLKVRTPSRARTTGIGVAFSLACLTRYDAWPVTAAALAAAVVVRRQSRARLSEAVRDVAPMAIYPAVTIGMLFLLSQFAVGPWFGTGAFVAESPAPAHPGNAATQVLTGVRSIGGTLTTVIGLVGLIGLLARGLLTDLGGVALVALAPAAAVMVPWIAFLEGYPHRARYMVPLLAAQAIGVGAASARWRGAAPVAAVVVMIVAGLELAPMFGASPVSAEAEWDLPSDAAPNAERQR